MKKSVLLEFMIHFSYLVFEQVSNCDIHVYDIRYTQSSPIICKDPTANRQRHCVTFRGVIPCHLASNCFKYYDFYMPSN